MAIDERYFSEFAGTLEISRNKARAKYSITYDCFNAITDGDVVTCKKEHLKGPLPLLSILRGRSARICHLCVDYDNGDEPGD